MARTDVEYSPGIPKIYESFSAWPFRTEIFLRTSKNTNYKRCLCFTKVIESNDRNRW